LDDEDHSDDRLGDSQPSERVDVFWSIAVLNSVNQDHQFELNTLYAAATSELWKHGRIVRRSEALSTNWRRFHTAAGRQAGQHTVPAEIRLMRRPSSSTLKVIATER